MENTNIIALSSSSFKTQSKKASQENTQTKDNFKDIFSRELTEKDNEETQQINSSKFNKKSLDKKDNDPVKEKKVFSATENKKKSDSDDKDLTDIYETALNLLTNILENIKNNESTNENSPLIPKDIKSLIETLNNQDIKFNNVSLELLNNLKSLFDSLKTSSKIDATINITLIKYELEKILKNLKEKLLQLDSNIIQKDLTQTSNNKEDFLKSSIGNISELSKNNEKEDKIDQRIIIDKANIPNNEKQTKNDSSFTLILNEKNKHQNNSNSTISANVEILDVNNPQVNSVLRHTNTLEINRIITETTTKLHNNIFNQIIESAKITLNEEVSEMAIKLKPDNLGNVSLKLVIERGMVLAKFDVENQIVKQALESNLEDLRSSLAEKGFQIKEFNVSVNKDSKKYDNFFNQSKKRKIMISKAPLEDYPYSNYISKHYSLGNTNKSINLLA